MMLSTEKDIDIFFDFYEVVVDPETPTERRLKVLTGRLQKVLSHEAVL